MPVRLPAQRPNIGEYGGVFLVRTVREVEPKHIDAGLNQTAQDRGVAEAGPMVATIFVRMGGSVSAFIVGMSISPD